MVRKKERSKQLRNKQIKKNNSVVVGRAESERETERSLHPSSAVDDETYDLHTPYLGALHIAPCLPNIHIDGRRERVGR